MTEKVKIMNIRLKQIKYFVLITFVISFATVAQAQTSAYRVSDRQVEAILDRIENKTNDFKDEVDRSLDKSSIDGTRREDSINQIVSNFENATDRLRDNFSSRRSSSADVEDVLNKAVFLNTFVRNNRMSQNAQNLWSEIRTDLNTLAGYYQVRYAWNDNVNTTVPGGYTVTDVQMRNLLYRLVRRNTAFRQSFNRWNTSYARRGQTESAADVSQDITEFERVLGNLSRNYNNRNAGNIDLVLRPSMSINNFIAANRTNNDVNAKWNLVRTDLSTLASYYSVAWDWNNPVVTPGNQLSSFDSRLTGTYRLNAALSDNVPDAVERAIDHADYAANEHDRMHRNLERRLTAPEILSFEKRGRQVTMSSANAQSVILNADGSKQTEISPNGRRVTTSVTATNTDLTINYEGDRINDYYVSFMPMSNGQLKVTRRVYLENQNQTVTVTSIYDKTSQTAQFDTVIYPTNTGGSIVNDFLIPNNTRLTATLDAPLSTKTASDGDRFSMTVTSPSQYNGAVIVGNVVGEKSGVVSGRAKLSLSFNTIRMRDGRTYRFAGIVEQVRETNGNIVDVNNEGSIRDDSQTTKTVTRAGIGAVLGAIIGAIAGGGSGAAIGAGVGAGAGAGTVILQGRDNLELASGAQFTITATAPANVGVR